MIGKLIYQSLTVFADGSWKNEKGFYNASKNKIHYYSSDEYTEAEIQKINNDIHEKTSVSNKAIKSNYFNNLNKKENIKYFEQEYGIYNYSLENILLGCA